jgi:hypothetical protein
MRARTLAQQDERIERLSTGPVRKSRAIRGQKDSRIEIQSPDGELTFEPYERGSRSLRLRTGGYANSRRRWRTGLLFLRSPRRILFASSDTSSSNTATPSDTDVSVPPELNFVRTESWALFIGDYRT